VEFVLVGTWQDDAIDYLRGIASPNVTFTGRLTDDELMGYYRKASVYVQPSLHEGFGMSVAEAMLAGCLPVTTCVGSLPEVVGDAGVIIDSADPKLISAAIHKALAASADARTLCRERILREFPLSTRRQRLEQVISSTLADARKGSATTQR
jgi:glycosyltransferase involved in cell wall biosynthesis